MYIYRESEREKERGGEGKGEGGSEREREMGEREMLQTQEPMPGRTSFDPHVFLLESVLCRP